jgi:hypothetical protein
MILNPSIITDIKAIIFHAREKAIRLADYGNYLTKFVSEQLEPEYGSGFSKRQVELFRQFYRTFPIANALRSQLGWTHYKMLIRLDNQDKREFYIAEALKNNWTTRQ